MATIMDVPFIDRVIKINLGIGGTYDQGITLCNDIIGKCRAENASWVKLKQLVSRAYEGLCNEMTGKSHSVLDDK